MDDETQSPAALYPSHDWGPLASDPFRTLGREDSETRSVLKQMWTRSGGDAALFDRLIPDQGAWARVPQKPPAIEHIKDGVKGFTVKGAVTSIEGWEATLEKSETPGVKTLVKDLDHLKRLIQDEKPKGEQIKKLLAKLGKETVTFAGKSGGENADEGRALGEALAHVAGRVEDAEQSHRRQGAPRTPKLEER